MSDVVGYFVDTVDGEGDVFICRMCVEEHGMPTDRSLDIESFTFLPMKCAIHLLGGKAEDYAKA